MFLQVCLVQHMQLHQSFAAGNVSLEDVCIAVQSSILPCTLIAVSLQVVEGLGIKEGDLLEFELTAERALRVTVMKSSTVTRKPKKLGVPELQASMAKKKAYRGLPDLSRTLMLTGQEGVAMSDLLLPAAAAAAAQGLPIRLPDVNATQVLLVLLWLLLVGVRQAVTRAYFKACCGCCHLCVSHGKAHVCMHMCKPSASKPLLSKGIADHISVMLAFV